MARAHVTSAGRERSKAGGRSARAKTRARGCLFASTSGATSSGRSIRRPVTRGATSRLPCFEKRSRPAACATRGAAVFPRIGCRAGGSRTRMWSRRSPAGSMMPTGRCSTRSTITARSSRARCSRPASPAAIATSRTAPSFARPATASAANATPLTNMPRPRTTVTRQQAPRLPVRPATCRRAPTWWSTGGTTTASASRAPTCR